MLAFFLAVLDNEQDRAAFRSIYEHHRPRMEQTALRILKRQSDAEDAVQNAFIQVIRHFEKIYEIPCEDLPFWLICIVKNEALMILRRRDRDLPLEDWDGAALPAEPVADYATLVALIRTLPESFRAVLEMKLLLGYTDKETAARLHISESAVSTRASRGRALLRRILEEEGITP